MPSSLCLDLSGLFAPSGENEPTAGIKSFRKIAEASEQCGKATEKRWWFSKGNGTLAISEKSSLVKYYLFSPVGPRPPCG